MEFDRNGKLILPKRFNKKIKHEEIFFDEDDYFTNDDLLLVNYEED